MCQVYRKKKLISCVDPGLRILGQDRGTVCGVAWAENNSDFFFFNFN